MPTYNFSSVKEIIKKEKAIKANSGYKIKLKDVQGVVFINNKAEYYILTKDDIKYPIIAECYSSYKKRIVYRQGEGDYTRVTWIRTRDNLVGLDQNLWLPFGIGCEVTGNIVHDIANDVDKFAIKSCDINYFNNKSHEALVYYRQHIEEITKIIRQKRYNGVKVGK